ncbi:o-succinylbenzoate--CoA ligase [Serratia grimesii]|uniref:o-succinylbenzoate--CoA ligase n=1 Tax=Serratia grimesii TaxID=82995 RepID=UPI00077C19C3|nr:o-succinylbenzoate--CoA ligase [Serratia grimesii]CAI0943524.1 2-succinylbenzoate--CoA ligase [Serratia grimesii]CAI1651330.1 2-succinylbenzoate--CoA ligase [Serratia grimesii]CAI2404289.1 2-succinylbenzoate--CoA ligase [Serratia grimesii]SUI35760.1 2-succinylbenzoate--CoA ligase [Serratia grimesii]
MAQLNDWPWRHWAQRRPQAMAVMVAHQPVSWLVLRRQVDKLAADFQHQGVEPGCGVALCGKNSYPLLLAYLALLQCGARLLPLNPALPVSLLATLLPDLDIDFAFSPDLLPTLPATVIRLNPPSTEHRWLNPPRWDAQRLATLTLTSGSSGTPKAAAHSYAAHLASAEGVLQLMDFQSQDRWLLSLPLFHVSGQGIVWRWLTAGGGLVVRDMHLLADALAGCTHASLVPTQLWRLLAQPLATLTLKKVLLGGAMIPVELTEQAEALGISCWCGYGLTELASTVCAKRADARPGVGLPLAGREIKLVNEEVWIRAQSLARGYWQRGALQPLADDQGWFHTRDRGVMEQGELRILGRLDNLFFSGGEGVQPEDIERVLAAHPRISQVVVVPVNDVEFGQRPVAVIDSEEPLSLEELLAWSQERLVNFQRPMALLAMPAELKSSGIKVSRRQLQQWVAQQIASR